MGTPNEVSDEPTDTYFILTAAAEIVGAGK
jgi:hypothetical protein